MSKIGKILFDTATVGPWKAEGSVISRSLAVTVETDRVSDGYHTFGELYEHRHALFLALMRVAQGNAWWSKLHSDGTFMDGWVLCCVEIPAIGPVSYHLPSRLIPELEATKAEELEKGKEWDGHTAADVVDRLKAFAALPASPFAPVAINVGAKTEITPEQKALGALREARAALLDLRDSGKPSRELSLSITEVETGLLWLQEDMRLKAFPVNEAACSKPPASMVEPIGIADGSGLPALLLKHGFDRSKPSWDFERSGSCLCGSRWENGQCVGSPGLTGCVSVQGICMTLDQPCLNRLKENHCGVTPMLAGFAVGTVTASGASVTVGGPECFGGSDFGDEVKR